MSEYNKFVEQDNIHNKYNVKVIRKDCKEGDVISIGPTRYYQVHYATSRNHRKNVAELFISRKVLFLYGNDLAVILKKPPLKKDKEDKWMDTLLEFIISSGDKLKYDQVAFLYPYTEAAQGIEEAIIDKFKEVIGTEYFDIDKLEEGEEDENGQEMTTSTSKPGNIIMIIIACYHPQLSSFFLLPKASL